MHPETEPAPRKCAHTLCISKRPPELSRKPSSGASTGHLRLHNERAASTTAYEATGPGGCAVVQEAPHSVHGLPHKVRAKANPRRVRQYRTRDLQRRHSPRRHQRPGQEQPPRQIDRRQVESIAAGRSGLAGSSLATQHRRAGFGGAAAAGDLAPAASAADSPDAVYTFPSVAAGESFRSHDDSSPRQPLGCVGAYPFRRE